LATSFEKDSHYPNREAALFETAIPGMRHRYGMQSVHERDLPITHLIKSTKRSLADVVRRPLPHTPSQHQMLHHVRIYSHRFSVRTRECIFPLFLLLRQKKKLQKEKAKLKHAALHTCRDAPAFTLGHRASNPQDYG
jgi:hypothetical protein